MSSGTSTRTGTSTDRSAELWERLGRLEAEVASMRPAPTGSPERHDDGPTDTHTPRSSRRELLVLGAGATAGAIAAVTTTSAAPVAAGTGDNMRLGLANVAESTTGLRTAEPFDDLFGPGPIALQIESPGAHLRFIGAPGDTNFGTYPPGTLVYNPGTGLQMWHQTAGDGAAPTLIQDANSVGALQIFQAPMRAYDSRVAVPGGSRIAAGETRQISISAADPEFISNTFDAVLVNLTVTATSGFGWLTAYSAARPSPPETSNVNWYLEGTTIANQAVAAASAGSIAIFCGGTGSTHFIVDVIGLYGS